MATPAPTLSAITTQAQLAGLLGTSVERLRFHLYSARAPKYLHFEIPKAGGGTRMISVPPPTVCGWQRRLHELLAPLYEPKGAVHGFVRGRSIATNAGEHVGRRKLLSVDIRDFFPTIHFGRVRGVFLRRPFSLPNEVASTLARLASDDGRLPQGAPTSPLIANLVCRRLDTDLSRLATKHGCRRSTGAGIRVTRTT